VLDDLIAFFGLLFDGHAVLQTRTSEARGQGSLAQPKMT
jgi:hypothetical protein